MKLLVHLLVLIGLSGLTGAAIVAHRAADLPSVSVGAATPAPPVNDIADLLGQATIKRSAPVEVSEADLNRFLAASLSGKQTGRSARRVAFEKVLVDLEPSTARVTLCWMVEGHRTTTSLDLGVLEEASAHRFEITRGAYGRMSVARGFMLPVMPAYEALGRTLAPEIGLLLNMTKIHIAKDKLVLDPRF